MDLFDFKSESESPEISSSFVPLAEKLRPGNMSHFFAPKEVQETVDRLFKVIQKSGRIPNLILWGPPGTGKTTLAHIIVEWIDVRFVQVNAVETGAKKLREIGGEAKEALRVHGRPTVLFIDEIHRLNKSQQDVLLPFTEAGHFSLIGATTENPGYEINAALLSRARVIALKRHDRESLIKIVLQAETELGITTSDLFDTDALDYLLECADGDARSLLNNLELLIQLIASQPELGEPLGKTQVVKAIEKNAFAYDKSSDEHYDTISAFIKSIRGSDPDAAIYYLARMLAGGEDPKFIARRLVILASEDVGNADPRALTLATSGFLAVEKVGLPEAAINLSQVVTYLASCPKSNKAYEALKSAQRLVKATGHLPIPLSLRSSQTQFAKSQGYGEGYAYSHEGTKGFVAQQFLPDAVKNEKFYRPTNRGFEKNIVDYLEWVKKGSDRKT